VALEVPGPGPTCLDSGYALPPPPPPPRGTSGPPTAPGQLTGYELGTEIGRGEMGVVFRARDQ